MTDERLGPFKRYERNWKGGNTERWRDWGDCPKCGQPFASTTKGHSRGKANPICGQCYLKLKAEERRRLGRR